MPYLPLIVYLLYSNGTVRLRDDLIAISSFTKHWSGRGLFDLQIMHVDTIAAADGAIHVAEFLKRIK